MIRLFNHYLSVRLLLLTALEAMVLFQSLVLGFQIRMPDTTMPLPLVEAGLFTIVMLLMMTALGLYQSQVESFRSTLQRLIVAYGLALIVMSVIFYLTSTVLIGRGVFAVSTIFALAGLLVVRLLFFRVTDLGLPKRRVLVLGHGDAAEGVIRFLHDGERGRTIQYAGMYPVISERSPGDAHRTINHEQLLRTIRDLRVSEIVIAVKERRGGVLPLRQLLDARINGVRVMDMVSFYEREQGILKVDSLRASWLIFRDGFDQGLMRDVIKRCFDVVVSLALLIVTFPILLVAILAIVLESGFPVFYRQERIGFGGRPFTILKLRSMVQNAEKDGKPQWATTNDARVTAIGRFLRKTRIDELPQLINVLRGDMSFVGPRPERGFFVDQLLEKIPFYDVRHSVKPGVTGWSQVRYPYGASVDDALAKLQYDLYYVKNHSLFLDLLILVETAQVVLLGKGAR
jgi:sugar transferase (PEP-CTERM system associated)